ILGASFGRRVAGEARSFVSRRVGATPKETRNEPNLILPDFFHSGRGDAQPFRDVFGATLGVAASVAPNGKPERNGLKTD
ncbi:MAG: hypothetical protein IJ387_01305, partial [Thermoguttaceae bacterium]|nr:hypothetical protein [Thermoguttaceae bacterium]